MDGGEEEEEEEGGWVCGGGVLLLELTSRFTHSRAHLVTVHCLNPANFRLRGVMITLRVSRGQRPTTSTKTFQIPHGLHTTLIHSR